MPLRFRHGEEVPPLTLTIGVSAVLVPISVRFSILSTRRKFSVLLTITASVLLGYRFSAFYAKAKNFFAFGSTK